MRAIRFAVLVFGLVGQTESVQAGVSRLTLESEVATGWLSQTLGVEGVFQRPDTRERNLLLRRDERERLKKSRKGLAPLRWWGGYRFSRMAYAGIGGAGDTEELGHRLLGGLGVRLLEDLDFNFQLDIEDYATEPMQAGTFEFTTTWRATPRWGLQFRGAVSGYQKGSGGRYQLASGSFVSSSAVDAQKTLWGLRLLGEWSPRLNSYIGGSYSVFRGQPTELMQAMNGFIELTPGQVFASSGLSPLRSFYAMMREIHLEAGIRFGGDPLDSDSAIESDPWYAELKADWSQSILLQFPSLIRVMPGVGFRLKDGWRVSLDPEVWISEPAVDWVVNLGLKVAL